MGSRQLFSRKLTLENQSTDNEGLLGYAEIDALFNKYCYEVSGGKLSERSTLKHTLKTPLSSRNFPTSVTPRPSTLRFTPNTEKPTPKPETNTNSPTTQTNIPPENQPRNSRREQTLMLNRVKEVRIQTATDDLSQ